MRSLWCLFVLASFLSCERKSKAAHPAIRSSQEKKAVSAVSTAHDSLEIVYYRKPFRDPERYTRFFTVTKIVDPSFFTSLENILRLSGAEEDSLRACMSEGKILIPLGGDAFRTVYFSRAAKPCEYLYVIRDGAFIYHDMPDSLSQMLDEHEKTAREPLPAADH